MHVDVIIINTLNKLIINNKLKILTTPIHPQSWNFRTITMYRMDWRRVSVETRRAGMKWVGSHWGWKEWDTCWVSCPGRRGRGVTNLMVNMHVCVWCICMYVQGDILGYTCVHYGCMMSSSFKNQECLLFLYHLSDTFNVLTCWLNGKFEIINFY